MGIDCLTLAAMLKEDVEVVQAAICDCNFAANDGRPNRYP